MVKRLGVSVIVTDELASFHRLSDQLDLEYQVWRFCVRRWVRRTLRQKKC